MNRVQQPPRLSLGPVNGEHSAHIYQDFLGPGVIESRIAEHPMTERVRAVWSERKDGGDERTVADIPLRELPYLPVLRAALLGTFFRLLRCRQACPRCQGR